MLVNRIKKVLVRLSKIKPPAHKIPIAASHHRVAAVVKPLTLEPSFNMAPAPKKPMPVTTPAAILVISLFIVRKENDTKRNDPRQTKIVVLRPIYLLRYCLSIPIKKLRAKQIIILSKKEL